MLAALLLYVVAGMLGIGMALPPAADPPRLQNAQVVEYLLTWCGTLALEGGPIFWVATHRIHHQHSDRDGDPHTPREGTWWAHMGWILTRRGAASRCVGACPLRAGSGPRSRSRRALQLALDVERHRRPRAAGVRRRALRALGHLLAHDRRPARNVAGELRDAQVGIAPLQDARRFHEQLVGRAADLRRRLAQQSSRSPDERASWARLVRTRSQLARHPHARALGLAWDIKAAGIQRTAAGSEPFTEQP